MKKVYKIILLIFLFSISGNAFANSRRVNRRYLIDKSKDLIYGFCLSVFDKNNFNNFIIEENKRDLLRIKRRYGNKILKKSFMEIIQENNLIYSENEYFGNKKGMNFTNLILKEVLKLKRELNIKGFLY